MLDRTYAGPERRLTQRDQREHWEERHRQREQEHKAIRHQPNEFAMRCVELIQPGGVVLEIGVANGRDARFFSRENGNKIIGVDISREAIRQLSEAAAEDGTHESILPIIGSAQELPTTLGDQITFDAFYCRSALHLDDSSIVPFLDYVTSHLNPGGLVMVQGKPREDAKIQDSTELHANLYEDANGHIRRAWSEQDIQSLCDRFSLEIMELERTEEIVQNRPTQFIHFIARKQ